MGSPFGQFQMVYSKQSFEESFTSQSLLTSSRRSCQKIRIVPLSVPRNNIEKVNRTRCNIVSWNVRSMSLKSHLNVPSSSFFSFRISENTFLAIQHPNWSRLQHLTRTAKKAIVTQKGGNTIIRLYTLSFIPSAQLVELTDSSIIQLQLMVWYEFVRYLEFYSTNEHSDWLILGHVPLIKLKYIPTSCYLDRDTIAQLLPTRRIQQHVISAWLN